MFTLKNDVRVFARDFDGRKSYSTSIGRKNKEGAYDNMFIPLQFNKGVEIENGTDIRIKNGFPSFYVNKDGKQIPQFIITDYEPVETKSELLALTCDSTRIFVRDGERKSYSTTISRKNKDGSYENMFVPVQFKQGIEVAHGTDIKITAGFPSFYTNKDGNQVMQFVIMEFEIV